MKERSNTKLLQRQALPMRMVLFAVFIIFFLQDAMSQTYCGRCGRNPQQGRLSSVTACVNGFKVINGTNNCGSNAMYYWERYNPSRRRWERLYNWTYRRNSINFRYSRTTYVRRKIAKRYCNRWYTSGWAYATYTVASTANNPGAVSITRTITCGTPTNISNVTSASTGRPSSGNPTYSFYYRGGPNNVNWTVYRRSTNPTAAIPSWITSTPGNWWFARNSSFPCVGERNNSRTVNIPMTVRPVTISAPSGTNELCIDYSMGSISHSSVGVTRITTTGLPPGVTAVFSGNVITISGTPTQSGTFPYSITGHGGGCTATRGGTITVYPELKPGGVRYR